MTPEEKSLLERTYKLVEENNDLLKSMRRNARWTTIMRIVYWAVVLFLSVGAYYAIQPYVTSLYGELGSLTSIGDGFNSATTAAQSLKSLLSK